MKKSLFSEQRIQKKMEKKVKDKNSNLDKPATPQKNTDFNEENLRRKKLLIKKMIF